MISKFKTRESNIELLRILAMIMIIMGHVIQHGIEFQFEDIISHPPSLYFNHFMFYKRLTFIQVFRLFGQIGNVIFIIITGYFLAEKKHINISKSLKKLLSQVLFATLLLVISSFVFYKIGSPNFKGLVDFDIFYSEWWFVGYYIVIIIMGELFLNKFLSKLNKKSYITFLLALFAIVSLKHPGDAIQQISSNLRSICSGVLIYSFGGYIKKYKPFKDIKTIVFVLLIVITLLEIGLSYHNYTVTNINNALYNLNPNYTQKLFHLDRYSVEAIVIGTSIFELFRRMKIKKSKFINYLAASTFMVYLIHENNFMWQIWQKYDWVVAYYYNMPKFFMMFAICVLNMFAAGVVAYILYSSLIKFFESKTFKKIIYKKGTV